MECSSERYVDGVFPRTIWYRLSGADRRNWLRSRFPDWDYLLASRKSQTGHWNFELTFFEGSEAPRPKHIQESFHNVDALKQALLELPKGTKINWGKYEMSGLVYRPHAVVADIERFAKAHQISLVFEFVPVE